MSERLSMARAKAGNPWLARLFVFACFFPFPALVSVGGAVGVTVAMVACLVLVLGRRSIHSDRPIVLAIAFCTAAAAAGFLNMLIDPSGTQASTINALFASALAVAPLFAVAFVPQPGRWGPLVGPVSLAVVVHVGVGWYQWQQFQSGHFPFVAIFNNPSFADIRLNSDEYALYIRRPFGLFPEPSALAAGLGPFILLLIRTIPDSLGARRLAGLLAVVGGSTLMLATQSAYLIFWLPLLAVTTFGSLSMVRSHIPRLVVFVAVGFGLWAAISRAVDTSRLIVSNNDSAQYRLQSIKDGIDLWLVDWHSFTIGSGPGSTVDRLKESGSAANSVHSLVVTQFVEWGLFAGAVWILVAFWAFRHGQRILALAWLVSVGLVTSYSGLAVLWLMLGILVAKERREDPARDSDAALGGSGAHAGGGSGWRGAERASGRSPHS